MLYSLDRITDGVAVLVDEAGRTRELAVALLPAGAAEGDILRETAGTFAVDADETRRRRERAEALLDELLKRGGG